KLLALRISKGVIKIEDYNSKAEILTDYFFLKVDILIKYLLDWIKLVNSINPIIIAELIIKEDIQNILF
ncbi:hypothetical protein NEUTE2DRAFT_59126, partial [Neurospora tetrasperma FGSC 2509]